MSSADLSSTQPSAMRYDELIRTVASLQSDLQATVTALTQLRAKNDDLEAETQRSKVEADNYRKQFLRARNDLIAETEQKAAFSERLMRMSTLLEQERRSFHQQISQLSAPTSVDEIRHEEQQRLEAAHKDELERCQAQARQFQEMWFNTRRDHELVLEEYADFKGALERQLDEAHGRHEAQVGELKRQLAAAEARGDGLPREEALRAAAKDAERLRISEAHLRAQLATAEEQLQGVREEAEARAQRHEAELNQLHSRLTGEAADRRGVDRQRREATLGLERARAELEGAQREARELRAEVQRLQVACANKDRALDEARKGADQRLEDVQNTWQLERAKLQQALDRAEERAEAAEAKRREADSALAVSERGAREAEVRARETEDALRRDADEHSGALRASLAEVRQREADAATAHAEEAAAQRLQVDALHTEKLRLTREKDNLHGKIKALQAQVGNANGDLSTHRRRAQELEKEHQALQAQHRALREAQHDEKATAAQLAMKAQYLEDDLASAASAADHERQRHVAALEELQRAHAADAEEARRQVEELSAELAAARERHEKDGARVRRRAEQYKAKAVEVHEQHKHAKQQLAHGRRQWEAARRELEGQVARLSSRVEQLEGDRVLLKSS